MPSLFAFIIILFLAPSAFSEVTSTVTKIVSGKPREIIYSKDKKEIARETFNERGDVTQRSGTIPDGIVYTYYPSGKLRAKSPYLHNEAEGVQEVYAESGQLLSLVPLKNGKTNGIAKDFFPNKKLKMETPYVNDKPEGVAREYEEDGKLSVELTYASGKLMFSKTYNKKGQLEAQNSWPDNPNGKEQIQTSFRKDGSIDTIETLDHKNGWNIGPRISFFPNGRIDRFEEFATKNRIRTYLLFDENGAHRVAVHDGFSVWIELLVSGIMVCLMVHTILRRRILTSIPTSSSIPYISILRKLGSLAANAMIIGGIYSLACAMMAFSRYTFPNTLFSAGVLLISTGGWLLVQSLAPAKHK